MKKFCTSLFLLFATFSAFADESNTENAKDKFYRGIEGGVYFNTGYAFENFPQCGYSGGGVPLGVGGRGVAILGNHLRVGGEGYMNTMNLDKQDSETSFAFGGAMADFYWDFGPVMAYIGSNIGGGILKTVIYQTPHGTWDPVIAQNSKQFIWAAHPYLGMHVKVAKKLNIIIQVSYTLPLNGNVCRQFNVLNTSIGLQFGT